MLIAGLDPTFYKQDLIEQNIGITLTRPAQYMDEKAFAACRKENLPRWRGAFYSLVAAVLRPVQTIKQTRSRFSVFARLGECGAQVLGRENGWFTKEYAKARLETALEAAAADSVYLRPADFLLGIDTGSEQNGRARLPSCLVRQRTHSWT